MPEQESRTRNTATPDGIADVIQSVKQYALQETVGPLRGAGRWIGYGIAGALTIGIGSAFLALGLLRMIQTEWPHVFAGRWMQLLPYLFGLVFCIAVVAVALSRVNKQPLNKEDR
ncbi:MAG: hypothetical protein WCI22_08480 [Actinomycetota bacterium]